MAAWRRSASMLALVVAVAAAAATCADAWHNYGASKFTVTGSVLCQDCTKSWNAYAYNAKPIPESVVGITCLDKETGRTVYHSVDKTDGKGMFNLEVPYTIGKASLHPSSCLVRLASSGNQGCAVFTNFNGGKTGERPSRPSHVYPGKVTYAAGPFYFTLTQCDDKGAVSGY
uniref:Pollen Ole e 1 allergen and extensin family protein n=1 Tax=Leersia perrieri TaxID=77586 RepID=A0A0D9XM40_9ORYZ